MNPKDLIPPEFREADAEHTRDVAVEMIHKKLDRLYSHEPNAKKEEAEVEEMVAEHEKLSKHQKYMKHLSEAGLDPAEVQVKWHEYYNGLPEDGKHEVWREFYSEQEALKKKKAEEKLAEEVKKHKSEEPHLITKRAREQHFDSTNYERPGLPNANLTVSDRPTEPIMGHNHGLTHKKREIRNKHLKKAHSHVKRVTSNHHVKSLAFGLSAGFVVVFILLFSFFNERFIIPFIRPNTHVSATPIIIDSSTNGPVGPEAKIIIPKVNVEAPVIYDVPTIEEKDVQAGLERGVVHYVTTPNPGEKGNSVIFGHSSGNILNKGKYKFAFLLLKSLDDNDTFIVQKDGKRYVYKVFNKYITEPTDVSVLQPIAGKIATMTLITCDPPGTSTHRLIIQAEQIFPDPAGNKESSVPTGTVSEPKKLPSNSPTLWSRLFGG